MAEEKSGKKVIMIVPAGRFEDNSYQRVRQILERYGHTVEAACSVNRVIFGLNKTRCKPDHLLDEIDLLDYDMIYLVCGIGAKEYFDHEGLHASLVKANEEGKFIAAMGNTPLVLANAGLLKDKKATVLFFEAKKIKAAGAEYTGKTITVDGNIITCKGPEASDSFGLALMKILSEQFVP